MNQPFDRCGNLQSEVNSLLDLLHQEPSLYPQQDTTAIEASLRKAISPKFEIVFAGAFSAGKSMLINALLERELLYIVISNKNETLFSSKTYDSKNALSQT